MSSDRIDQLQQMLERRPEDPRLRFGLAAEYEKREDWQRVIEHLRAYLAHAEDEGNAWGRLGNALRRSGQDDEAKDAYRHGADAARRHGHPSMAAEFEETLENWEWG